MIPVGSPIPSIIDSIVVPEVTINHEETLAMQNDDDYIRMKSDEASTSQNYHDYDTIESDEALVMQNHSKSLLVPFFTIVQELAAEEFFSENYSSPRSQPPSSSSSFSGSPGFKITKAEKLRSERKFIVTESQLRKLMKYCPQCGCLTHDVAFRTQNGFHVTANITCSGGKIQCYMYY